MRVAGRNVGLNKNDWIKLNNKIKPEILLSTAVIYIRNDTGNVHKVRALLDNGSQLILLLKQRVKN